MAYSRYRAFRPRPSGCLPEPLFRRGVTAIGGAWIEDREGFKRALACGSKWGGSARKFVIERSDYPGVVR